jgi:tetratricopeptide (TPR) repeat protein
MMALICHRKGGSRRSREDSTQQQLAGYLVLLHLLTSHKTSLVLYVHCKGLAPYLRAQVALCFEVIRRAPNIADPYTTLGLIYDSELGDKKRALEFYMLAAHITAKYVPIARSRHERSHGDSYRDADKWRQVAEMSLEQGNRKQALYCYTRLLKLQPNDEVLLA